MSIFTITTPPGKLRNSSGMFTARFGHFRHICARTSGFAESPTPGDERCCAARDNSPLAQSRTFFDYQKSTCALEL
jgi:hypothetical protein